MGGCPAGEYLAAFLVLDAGSSLLPAPTPVVTMKNVSRCCYHTFFGGRIPPPPLRTPGLVWGSPLATHLWGLLILKMQLSGWHPPPKSSGFHSLTGSMWKYFLNWKYPHPWRFPLTSSCTRVKTSGVLCCRFGSLGRGVLRKWVKGRWQLTPKATWSPECQIWEAKG